MKMQEQLTIIGAGCGGIELAIAARQNGWAGPITVYDADPDWPYHRPPLSKAYMKGSAGPLDLILKTEEALEKACVELQLGVAVTAIDREAKQVFPAGRPDQSYDKLVLATGGRPRPFPDLDRLAPRARNLFYLRTLQDAARIKEHLTSAARLVVIGGGYIGLELAATARYVGAQAIILEGSHRLLQRVTSPEISAFFRSLHEDNGVTIHTSAMVSGFKCDALSGDIHAVSCNGMELPCDLVVVGIGQLPNVKLAEAAGLVVEDGIVVDEFCRTSDANIYALGDCARFPSSLFGGMLRLESVPNATEHARLIAAHLCGKPQVQQSVPWFWSDQYDIQLKTAGLLAGYDNAVLRGSMAERKFSVLYLKDSRLIAADTFNNPADFMWSKRLIEAGIQIVEAYLADSTVPLKSLLAR
jgi:3-phenylpropionate/trans-cinnamate dioxygenase ferredoxin reductase subunit